MEKKFGYIYLFFYCFETKNFDKLVKLFGNKCDNQKNFIINIYQNFGYI